MSRIRVDRITNNDANGAVDFPNGLTATSGSFSGNVSVGGTLTYEDVTNVDSVGIITAKSGIRVGAGQSISAVSGTIYYYGDGSNLEGVNTGSGGDSFNELDAALFN